MILSYRLLVNGSEVFVSLEATSGNQYAPIQYRGEEEAIAQVRAWLGREYGAFGHRINPERTNPIDLEAAMTSERSRVFQPLRISGGELVQRFDAGLPPGCMS